MNKKIKFKQMKKITLLIAMLSIVFAGCENKSKNVNPFKQGYKNIVDEQTIIKSEQSSFSKTESLKKVFDTDRNTKFLVNKPKNIIIVKNKAKSVLKKYAITSANDAPGRDPKNWTLKGSIDGVSWKI